MACGWSSSYCDPVSSWQTKEMYVDVYTCVHGSTDTDIRSISSPLWMSVYTCVNGSTDTDINSISSPLWMSTPVCVYLRTQIHTLSALHCVTISSQDKRLPLAPGCRGLGQWWVCTGASSLWLYSTSVACDRGETKGERKGLGLHISFKACSFLPIQSVS